MGWCTTTKDKLDLLISKLPEFHRSATLSRISALAEKEARLRGAESINDDDVVAAVTADVMSPFYSMVYHVMRTSGFSAP